MNSKIIWQSLGAVILVIAVFFAISLPSQNAPTPTPTSNPQTIQILLTVESLYSGKSVSASAESTILDLLTNLNTSERTLKLKTKNYKGLGTLVESMGGRTNGTDNKYWQYYVNGEMPQVGADKYVLKGGEKIEWKFDASQY